MAINTPPTAATNGGNKKSDGIAYRGWHQQDRVRACVGGRDLAPVTEFEPPHHQEVLPLLTMHLWQEPRSKQPGTQIVAAAYCMSGFPSILTVVAVYEEKLVYFAI